MASPSAPPALSAIISTYDRAPLLRLALESLCRQTLGRDQFEVVVVDDGSTDDTREVVRSFEGRLPLRYSRQRNAGLASARNHGLYLARGEIALFLDDDGRADPGLLAAHVRAHGEGATEPRGVVGVTAIGPAGDLGSLARAIAGEIGGAHRGGGGAGYLRLVDQHWSCRRAFIAERESFDVSLDGGFEHAELAFRLARHGLRLRDEPAAVVHPVRDLGFDDACRAARAHGRGRRAFASRHPEYARETWGGVERLEAEWRAVAPDHDRLLAAGRELDRIVRTRAAEGLPIGDFESSLLRGAASAALSASALKGFSERVEAGSARAHEVRRRDGDRGDLAPRVSIVIPVFNKLELTRQCLAAIARTTPRDLYELIVVDNASTDGTAGFLAALAGTDRAIVNADNRGFVGACNQGAEIARGEWVLFLNNDTEPRDGWLQALLATADGDPLVGAVGARLVYPDGTLQEAGGLIFRDGSGWNFGKGDGAPYGAPYDVTCEVDYCSGAALMVRADVLRRLGGFDARYAPAYYEDTDLCFGVRSLGLKVVYCAESTVVHHEGATAGTDVGSGFKRFQVINHSKFIEKWQAALARQDPPPTETGQRPVSADRRRLQAAGTGAPP